MKINASRVEAETGNNFICVRLHLRKDCRELGLKIGVRHHSTLDGFQLVFNEDDHSIDASIIIEDLWKRARDSDGIYHFLVLLRPLGTIEETIEKFDVEHIMDSSVDYSFIWQDVHIGNPGDLIKKYYVPRERLDYE